MSVKGNAISFTPLSSKSTFFGVKLLYGKNRPETRQSLLKVKDFLNEFLNVHDFYEENELKICSLRTFLYFFIDYKYNKIFWIDEKVYPLHKRSRLPFRSKRVILVLGKAINIQIYSKSGKCKLTLLSSEILEPKNLKSLFLNENDGKPKSCRSPFEFELELVADEHALLRIRGLYERAGSWFNCDMFKGPDFECSSRPLYIDT